MTRKQPKGGGEHRPREGPTPRPWRWVIVAASIVVPMLVVVPLATPSESPTGKEAGSVTPSGPGQADGGTGDGTNDVDARIEVGCAGPCKHGELLLFRVTGLERAAYLGAYAVDARGETIWFFPTEQGHAPRVQPSREPRLVPRGVRLSEEVPPGRYRIHTWLTRGLPTRAQLAPRDGGPAPHRGPAIVATQELELEVGP